MIQHHILIEQRANRTNQSHAFPSHPQLPPCAICYSFVNNGAQRQSTKMCSRVLPAMSSADIREVDDLLQPEV